MKQNNSNNQYVGKAQLYDSEKYLKNYNKYLVDLIAMFFDAKKHKKILEFGAGIGTLSNLFEEKFSIKPDAIEIDKDLIYSLNAQGFKVFSSIKLTSKKYDFIYSSNVLEHIKNDTLALQEIHAKMSNQSLLVLYLPAFMFLYSDMDKSVGHYRRYNSKNLFIKLRKCNFEIIHSRYVDSLGFFCLILLKILGYKEHGNLDNPKNLKIYDKYLFRISVFIDKYLRFNFFLGKNILVVCRAKN